VVDVDRSLAGITHEPVWYEDLKGIEFTEAITLTLTSL
jgi:hypothetical protein